MLGAPPVRARGTEIEAVVSCSHGSNRSALRLVPDRRDPVLNRVAALVNRDETSAPTGAGVPTAHVSHERPGPTGL
jgi:hypothetical protein